MVPPDGRDSGIEEQAAYDLNHGIQREVGPLPEIQYPIFSSGGWRSIMEKSPAPIEDGPPKRRRNIEFSQLGGAQRHNQQNELQIRQIRMLDVQRLHDQAL
jgi:hypothetical protein